MQSKDIVVGEDYAYASYLPRRRMTKTRRANFTSRVKVLAVSGAGVEVGFYKDDDGKRVTRRDIVESWQSVLEERDYADAQARAEFNEAKAARSTLKRILPPEFFDARRSGLLAHRYAVRRDDDGSVSGLTERVTITNLAKMIQAAYDAGKADA